MQTPLVHSQRFLIHESFSSSPFPKWFLLALTAVVIGASSHANVPPHTLSQQQQFLLFLILSFTIFSPHFPHPSLQLVWSSVQGRRCVSSFFVSLSPVGTHLVTLSSVSFSSPLEPLLIQMSAHTYRFSQSPIISYKGLLLSYVYVFRLSLSSFMVPIKSQSIFIWNIFVFYNCFVLGWSENLFLSLVDDANYMNDR